MDRVAVLIPCFNEAKTIKKVVSDFKKALPGSVVYVYDNNSTDDTVNEAKKAGAVVRYEYRQGKGQVVRRMFQEIEADHYILVDGDNTYPADAAKEMIDLVSQHNSDMVVGDRLSSTYFKENKRLFHNTGNTVVRFLINSIFKTDIKDVMTGYRAFSRRFVKTFPVLSKGFELETEMSVHAASMNMQVDNVVVEYRDRSEGSNSKLNTYSDGIKVIMTILKLFRNYRPLSFFSIVSLIILLIDAIVLSYVVLVPYFNTGLVPNYPTLIVGGFVGVTAVMLFLCGLILDSVWQKERREFEFRLMMVENEKKNK
ncbi:glycosyltransferase [Candidatus Saccharibacteria bacterium]|nr:glycosyltransferase [Candidatus Saccharibacteria bacterium]